MYSLAWTVCECQNIRVNVQCRAERSAITIMLIKANVRAWASTKWPISLLQQIFVKAYNATRVANIDLHRFVDISCAQLNVIAGDSN